MQSGRQRRARTGGPEVNLRDVVGTLSQGSYWTGDQEIEISLIEILSEARGEERSAGQGRAA